MEPWKIFYEEDSGKEFTAYTIRGTFEGEEEATRQLIAHENNLDPEKIKTKIEYR